MTKEEKIKEAWSKLIPDYTNIDLNNGWSLDDFHEDSYKENEFHTQQIYTPCKIRPKSLQDIEINNGWKRIEGQHDLPDIDTDYWVVYKGEVTKRAFNHNLPRSVEFWTDNITHYQPIEKPKPPLY